MAKTDSTQPDPLLAARLSTERKHSMRYGICRICRTVQAVRSDDYFRSHGSDLACLNPDTYGNVTRRTWATKNDAQLALAIRRRG